MSRPLHVASAAVTFAAALTATPAWSGEPQPPQTAADHRAMARSYTEKAAAWRAEAAYHRDMVATYRKEHPDRRSGARNPWTVEMERHCGAIVKDVQQRAAEAEQLANYHRLRALELDGR